MFCGGCGQDLSNVKTNFCASCGTRISGYSPTMEPQNPWQFTAPVPPQMIMQSPNPILMGGVAGEIAKRKAKAFASVIVAMLIFTMSYGWVSWPETDDTRGRPPQWSTFYGIRVTNWSVQRIDATYDALFREQQGAMYNFSRMVTISWIGTIASSLGLAIFLYFMLIADNRASRIGQVFFLAAIASSLYFIGHVSLTGVENLPWTWPYITISLWAYLTLALGIVGFLFVTTKKHEIDG